MVENMQQHNARVEYAKRIRAKVRAGHRLEPDEALVLLKQLTDYEGAITWDTSCLNCAQLLDQLYLQDSRIEEVVQYAHKAWGTSWMSPTSVLLALGKQVPPPAEH